MGSSKPNTDALPMSASPDAERQPDTGVMQSSTALPFDDQKKPLSATDIERDAKLSGVSANTPSAGPETTLATKALRFAADASPGTLAGIAIGFSAVTYIVLGRVGLLLVGAFGGILGFISWESRNPEVARAVRGEKGIDVLERLGISLSNTKGQADGESEVEAQNEEQFAIKAFDEFRPETREAMGGLVDAVIRDYVKWWYNPIVPTDHAFPLACRRTLTSYLLGISNHLYRKRPADTFLDLLTNSSSIIIVFMSELASAFADLPPDNNTNAVDAVYNYLASNPNCHLANLLNQNQQSAKFKMVSEDMLRFLDQNSYNCDPARVFLREIMANSVFEATLQRCSKAEWINGWIVYLLEAGEPDLNQAIDVGMQTGRDSVNNAFADMDGNLGNIGVAKPARSSTDIDRGRRKETSAHKKKLSKAEEELEEAMEEMKRMNAMIARDDKRRSRASTVLKDSDKPELLQDGSESLIKEKTPGESSPTASRPTNINTTPGTSTDGVSSRSQTIATPVSPRSAADASSPNSSPRQSGGSRFTSFDQIAPRAQNTGSDDEETARKAVLTLHNASFTLHDDGTGDKGRIRSKPNWDYLIQVEPSSPHFPGWMIVRRYSDFETLHEILRRIAAISGATAFTELHKELPAWKIHTRESLRGELERYLRDACWYQSLAESEGTKRFLEKSQGHTHGDSKTFGWETVGKNMLDVLTIAPKGAMEGGKTLVGGVSGVFNNFPGLSRKSTSQSMDLTANQNANRLSISNLPRMESSRSPARSERASMDSQRSSVISTQPGKIAPMDRRPSYQSQAGDADGDFRSSRSDRMDSVSGPTSARPSREHSRASSLAPLRSPSSVSLGDLRLPPHPDEIADDYEVPMSADSYSRGSDGVPSATSPVNPTSPAPLSGKKGVAKPARQYSPLSESETRVAVELIFAVINEMYTLSSAWNIRRTLLTAAKSFLLRPGNPSLLTVQSLIQSSLLETNTSDTGIAAQLRKLRENTMPTEDELASWPAEMTNEEKEKLRVRARQLLIRSGVPAALMGVMGQAATSEALGRVFDCLQIEEVARGLIFGLMLQAARVITH